MPSLRPPWPGSAADTGWVPSARCPATLQVCSPDTQEPGHLLTELQGLPVPRCHNHGCTRALHHHPEQASSSRRRADALQPKSLMQMGFTSPLLLRHQIRCSTPVRAAQRAAPNCPSISLNSSQRWPQVMGKSPGLGSLSWAGM